MVTISRALYWLLWTPVMHGRRQSMKRSGLIQRINDPVQSERIWTGPDSDIDWPMDYGLDRIIKYFLTCSRNKIDKFHQDRK